MIRLFITFLKRKIREQNLNYHILILTTPIITLAIMLYTPLEDIIIGNELSFFLCIYISLVLLNIINYWLLSKSYKQEQMQYKLSQMEIQIAYLKEKYLQLGTTYKVNRRLIHDIKKHYFIIEEHLKRKEYEELYKYLQLSIKDIENTYTEINTGNLVIDSFVSNFKTISKNNAIQFSTSLQVDASRIPINDYELCVILGNLLDNSFNACRQNTTEQNHINLTISVNENDIFYIHIENTYDHTISPPSQQNPDFSKHGYGINNIQKIIEKEHGFLKYDFGEKLFNMDIIIPIIDVNKRIHPPAKSI